MRNVRHKTAQRAEAKPSQAEGRGVKRGVRCRCRGRERVCAEADGVLLSSEMVEMVWVGRTKTVDEEQTDGRGWARRSTPRVETVVVW